MSDDLVERVARAICQAHCSHWGMHFRHIARAALAAIEAAGYVVVPREPTEAMKRVVVTAGTPYPVRVYWRAMLDAARKKDKANVG